MKSIVFLKISSFNHRHKRDDLEKDSLLWWLHSLESKFRKQDAGIVQNCLSAFFTHRAEKRETWQK